MSGADSTTAPVSALQEILQWSLNRQPWQRDALRRIITQGDVTDSDIAELLACCLSENECGDDGLVQKSRPLDASHIPSGPSGEESVTLASIGQLRGVNKLPSDQEMPFGPPSGLTVIYGDNGSGKSGYARVIKKACRSRGSAPIIQPNAYNPDVPGPASARLIYRVAGNEIACDWIDGQSAPSPLSQVFVFDSATARNYLEEDGPASFTPWGLDVLPRLSKVCDKLNQAIGDRITSMTREIEAASGGWKYPATTKVASLISQLSWKTTTRDVDELAVLSEQEQGRLKELEDVLRADPRQKARETRAIARRLLEFKDKVAGAAALLSDEQMGALKQAVDEFRATAEAAKSLSNDTFDSTYLSDTGGKAWRSLWEAARTYSVSHAYPDRDFPAQQDGDRCVLCQQDLNELARERLSRFDAFCKDRSQQLADEARKKLSDLTQAMAEAPRLTSELTRVGTDLELLTDEEREGLKSFASCTDSRLDSVQAVKSGGPYVHVACPASPHTILDILIKKLEDRARLEESAVDPDIRTGMERERNELAARAWLSEARTQVLDQIGRHHRLRKLESCQKQAATNQLTVKNSELSQKLVTEAFCLQFRKDLKSFGLRTVNVEMEPIKGKNGETRFGLRLSGAGKHKPREVTSEGEQRCIALAAFLAELSQASHQSALVFDDPVSSLDHYYRQRIAARLAKESLKRQVIVFTHDSVFLSELQNYAEEEGASLALRFLEWFGDYPGYCREGLPWLHQTPLERLNSLDIDVQALAKRWPPHPNDELSSAIRRLYGSFRATLERIVEHEVFDDVVSRFRSHVKFGKLKNVIGFSEDEHRELSRLYYRACDITEAHDPASGRSPAVPEPDELVMDIQSAKSLVNVIRKRRKGK